MKVATVSTLWDYINRAMPWTQPKSLSTEEVYAVTAFMLNLGGIVPENFTLSDKNMAEVQARMPNRNGMTPGSSRLWPGKGLTTGKAPDTKNVACMKDCVTEASIASSLPEHARNAHGNLAEQNRAGRAAAWRRHDPSGTPGSRRAAEAKAVARSGSQARCPHGPAEQIQLYGLPCRRGQAGWPLVQGHRQEVQWPG